MPSKQPYPARNYALGEFLLTLRSRTKLTQAELAARIGVHRRSVQKWESGESYPTAENLRPLIEVLINLGVFTSGQERAEVADLWQRVSQGSPQQFPRFDAAWLDQVIAGQGAPPPALVDNAPASRRDAPPLAEPPPERSDPKPALTLPFQPTPLIGRSTELTEIARILADPACHLLTLLGPGGIGKTRLALEVATTQTGAFRDGVAFVALTAVGAPSQIVSAIGEALNLSFIEQSDATTYLLDYLHSRRMLLVLDDFEHLLEGADLVYAMLQAAPQLTILVTSRVRLNLQAEWLFDVEGLAYPPSDSYSWGATQNVVAPTDYSAVQLFVQRAMQVQPGFALSEAALMAIVRICQYVAGMPLAIELAATSVRRLPIAEIEHQIRSNLDLLATSLRDVPARHRSLRAVFDHSWALLSEAEQVVLSRLAIFRGGWEQAAAEAICAYITRQMVQDPTVARALPFLPITFSPALLAALIDKSLVRSGPDELRARRERSVMTPGSHITAEPRFVLLEPIREYALAQLAKRGEAALLQRAHALYYLELAEAVAAQWVSPTGDAAIEQLDRERDNLRTALQWACAGGDYLIGLQLAGALIKFWRRRGALSEGRAWLEQLLALDAESPDTSTMKVRLRAMQGAAWLASDQHDYTRATQLFEQSIVLRQALGETENETNLLVNAGLQARAVGQYSRATALLETALAQQRALGNGGTFGSFGLGLSLFLLGLVHREQGDFARATMLFEECVQFHRSLGNQEGMAVGLLGLSDVARDQGDVVQIRIYGEQSLVSLRQIGAQWAIGFALNNLALAAYQAGDLTHALALIGESGAIFRAQKAEGSLAEVLITQGQILRAHGDAVAAHTSLTEALRLAWAVGPRLLVAAALEQLACGAALLGGDLELTTRLLAAAATLRTQLGTPVRLADQLDVAQVQATTRAALGAAAFAVIWSEAAQQPLEQILKMIPRALARIASPAELPAKATGRLTSPAAPVATTAPPTNSQRIDWGMAQDVPLLVGRAEELATLTQWVMTDQCRVIALVGIGGIGKTSLAVTFARQVTPHFAHVVFRSLGEAPPFTEILDQLIQSVAAQQIVVPSQLSDKLALLIDLLRQARCLLILDNLETIRQVGSIDAPYLPGYEAYGALFKALGETAHQSCLLLTSRERLSELAALEGPRSPVRALRVSGLPEAACRTLLADQELVGAPGDAAALARRYDGNPLALKLVAEPIRALFSGDIVAFLNEGNLFFDGVGALLAQQISRASALEQALLTWLAIVREPATLAQLMEDLTGGSSRNLVLAALQALWRRNLIERGQVNLTFALQRVVLEYLTEQLIERAVDEILQGRCDVLLQHALTQVTVKDYVRRSQERLITRPLLDRLLVVYAEPAKLEQQLLTLLDAWRGRPPVAQGYGPGNILHLLYLLRGHLRGLNLADLALRQAYFQGVEVQDTSLAGALIQDTVFTDTFDALTAVTVSRTGEYWAAVSRRGEVLVWSPGRGGALGASLLRTWRAHETLVWTLVFSPDGRTLASGSWDGTVKLWDITSGALLWVGRHLGHVNRVTFAPDGSMVASSGSDATVRLWHCQGGAPLHTLAHPGPVAVVAWSPDGDLLASGDLEGHISLWALPTTGPATCVQTLTEHATWVDGLAFTPDGRTLASASYDGTVKLWDVSLSGVLAAERARLRQTLTAHMEWVHRLAWSPDGRLLASCSFESTIWLWDSEQGNYRAPLQGHTAVVYDLAFTPDGSNLLSGSEDGTLRVWDVANGQCSRVMEGYMGALYDVDWSPDSQHLVSVGTNALVSIYAMTGRPESLTQPRLLRGHTNVVFGVGWSSTGRWLASSELDNAIRLWNPTSGVCLQVLAHPEDPANFFYGLAWSPDGQRLACGTSRRGVLVWDVKAQRPTWTEQLFPTKIRPVAWSPNGAQLAGGGDDGVVYVWDTTTGSLLQQLAGHRSMITSLAWSPDGTRLAASGSGKENGEIFVWEVQHGERVGVFGGYPGLVYGVTWGLGSSPGAEVLVSGGGDGMLRWWDIQSGECIRARAAHQGTVQALRRSPDGTKLASCGDDGAIMLWDLHSGELRQAVRRDRPYERMDITGIRGLTAAQRTALLTLGAVER